VVYLQAREGEGEREEEKERREREIWTAFSELLYDSQFLIISQLKAIICITTFQDKHITQRHNTDT
jgi:hypothetical protein